MIRSITPVPEIAPVLESSVPAPRTPESPIEGRPTTGVLGLLAAGVPLTLLFDLMSPAGPNSREIFREEFDAAAVRLFA